MISAAAPAIELHFLEDALRATGRFDALRHVAEIDRYLGVTFMLNGRVASLARGGVEASPFFANSMRDRPSLRSLLMARVDLPVTKNRRIRIVLARERLRAKACAERTCARVTSLSSFAMISIPTVFSFESPAPAPQPRIMSFEPGPPV